MLPDKQAVVTGVWAFMATLAAAMDLTWGIILGGVVGAALSLFALEAATATRSRCVVYVLGGTALAVMATPSVAAYLDVTRPATLTGVALVIGLYGLSLVQESFSWARAGGLKIAFNAVLKKIGLGGDTPTGT